MRVFPLGLSVIAEATEKAGHDVRILDLMIETDPAAKIEKTIAEFSPDVIGLSVRNIDDQNMKNTVFMLDQAKTTVVDCRKHSRATLVLGGAGYSIFPESALEYCGADFGIHGDGESAFPAFLRAAERGDNDYREVPGLYARGRGLLKQNDPETDPGFLPAGNYGIWSSTPDKENVWLPIQSRRGCPMGCSYCSTSYIQGRSIRKLPTESVVRAVARGVEAGFRNYFFTDNIFNMPTSYTVDLCRAISNAGLDINWRSIINPLGMEKSIAASMARAGCVEISLGFESGCARILRMMNKKFTPEDVRSVRGMFRDIGIRVTGFLLLGGPGETRASVEESLAFADSLDLDMLRLTTGIRIYPGTQLAEIAMEEGKISRDDDLLFPRFYIADGIEDWLPDTVALWSSTRKHLIIG